MKKFTQNFLVIVTVALLTTSCGSQSKLPEGFEVVWNKANVYFVYLHENLRFKKSNQRRACTQLCKQGEHDQCEVYMWSKREIIPEKFPIRNEGSFVHSYFKITDKGKKKYKCLECT